MRCPFYTTLLGLAALPLALGAQRTPGGAATVAQARAFADSAERRLATLGVKANQAQWVAATYITDDTEALSADATEQLNVTTRRLAAAAKRFDGLTLPADVRRKLTLLKLAFSAPPPSDPAKATELT